MCVSVVLNGKYFGRISELEDALGDLVFDSAWSDGGADFKVASGDTWPEVRKCCLCPVNMKATAEKHGLSIKPGWDDHGCDFVLTGSAA